MALLGPVISKFDSRGTRVFDGFTGLLQPIFGENCHKARGKLASHFLAQLGQSDLTAMERDSGKIGHFTSIFTQFATPVTWGVGSKHVEVGQ